MLPQGVPLGWAVANYIFFDWVPPHCADMRGKNMAYNARDQPQIDSLSYGRQARGLIESAIHDNYSLAYIVLLLDNPIGGVYLWVSCSSASYGDVADLGRKSGATPSILTGQFYPCNAITVNAVLIAIGISNTWLDKEVRRGIPEDSSLATSTPTTSHLELTNPRHRTMGPNDQPEAHAKDRVERTSDGSSEVKVNSMQIIGVKHSILEVVTNGCEDLCRAR